MSGIAISSSSGGPMGDVLELTGNSGGPVGPSGLGNINIVGSGIIDVVGNPGTNTLTISTSGADAGTITGNDGTPEAQVANNWNIVTANSTATFTGSAGTETLDFGVDNLFLGSSGSTITSGTENTAYGYLVASSITSGTNNSMFGFEAMSRSTTSSQCTSIGAYSMLNANIGAHNNTAIGYDSLGNINTGVGNSCLGYSSGSALTLADSNNIMISNTGIAGDSAAIRIGNPGTQTTTYIAGVDGVALTTANVVTETGNQLGTAVLTPGAGISIDAISTPNQIIITNTGGSSSITITGDTGGALTDTSFIFTGGSTGLTFNGSASPSTETLSGTLAIANGGTNATSMANTDGVVYYDGTRLVTTAVGTATNVLTSNGAGLAPTFQSIPTPTLTNANTNIAWTGLSQDFQGDATYNNLYIGSTGLNGSLAPGYIGQNTTIGGLCLTAAYGSGQVFSLTAIGYGALQNASAASAFCTDSTAIGVGALGFAQNSDADTAIGSGALRSLNSTTASSNTALGAGAGSSFTGGANYGQNTFLGALAGAFLGTGQYNLIAGFQGAFTYTNTESSNIILNSPAVIGDNHTLRIGAGTGASAFQLQKAFISGITGVNVGSTASVLTMGTGATANQLGTAVLTPGSGISITPGANTITIASTGGGFVWHDVTGGSATLAAQNGYIADAGGLTTFTMPTNNAFGDTIKIVGKGSGGWTVIYGAGQSIIYGPLTSTTTTGNIASTTATDCIELVCTTASATAPIFTINNGVGNITVV